MAIGNKLTDRYEIKQTLGQGGMGVVYWAYDTLIRRDVAVKTIRDMPEKAALDLFYKECNILASISHPNIIEIFDIGKFQDEGAEKPYFVMPLLKGVTLDNLIRNSSRRLTVERTVDILCQTCRGLQAAHEHGLVHRDLKPSNIFVLDDDSVKIIDFGVAHMADARTASAPKGTLLYMSPEQIQLKPATALSDIFTLGVVAYESLTLRRPFDGATYRDIANAILNFIPPPASDINVSVSPLLGRVIHKTMAKQPWNRFSTSREFAEALQKALRNEPIEAFNAARILPRIERANKAFEAGDHQFASEILTELESEGHLVPEMVPLRRKIDQATRTKKLAQLLESARTRIEDQEFPLALQKVQEVLDIDPENAEALRLQHEIEANRSNRQVDEWFRLARQHLDRFAFSHARQAVDNVLQLQPANAQAQELMSEIQRREQQYLQMRQEKEKLYQSALEAYEKAELSSALSKLERVLELDKKAPEISSSERGASYQSLYNQVRSAQDANMAAYAEARRLLAEGNFNRAIEVTEEALKKYPGQALFQALRFDIEEQKRQKLSSYIAETDRAVAAEPNLDKRVDILRSALEQFPEEQHFDRALRLIREKRDLVNSIVAKARRQEEQAQFQEALGQWEILRTVYGQYPGLEFEIERVSKRKDQQARDDGRVRLIEQIDRQIEARDFTHAGGLLRQAQAEFPNDPELEELAKLIRQGEERNAGAQALIDQGRAMVVHGRFEEAATLLRRAYEGDEKNLIVRGILVDTLLQHARSVLDRDWRRAGDLIQSALDLDSTSAQARSMSTLIADRKRDEAIDQCLSRARQFQAGGDISTALATVEQVLALYPTAARLLQLKTTLQRSAGEVGQAQSRRADLEKLTELEARAEMATDINEQREIMAAVRELAARHLDDDEFQKSMIALEKRYMSMHRASLPPTHVGGVDLDAPTIDPRNAPAGIKPPTPPPPAANPNASPADFGTIVMKVPEAPAPDKPPEPRVPVPPPPPPPKPPEVRPQAILGTQVIKTQAYRMPEAAAAPPAVRPANTAPETAMASGSGNQAAPASWNVLPPPPPPAGQPPPPPRPPQPGQPSIPGTPPQGLPPTGQLPPRAQQGFPPAGPQQPQKPQPGGKKKGPMGLVVASVGLVLTLAIGGYVWHKQQKPPDLYPPPTDTSPLDVRTDPPGATILINERMSGNSPLQLKLPPNTYRINAVRDGYRPFETSVTVTSGHNASVNMTLQAQPTTLRLLTDFASAVINLDGHPQSSLQGGQFILDNVAPGPHVLNIGSGTAGASIHFTAREGEFPDVTSLQAAQDTSAILITNLAARARVYTSQKSGSVNFDGRDAGAVNPLGVELPSVGTGDHEIEIGEGKDHRKVVYETAKVPALTIYLNNEKQQAVGTLVVTTGEDDVVVSLDGHPIRMHTQHGVLRIPNLPEKQYAVSVAKEGFQPVPAQSATIKKGEEAKVGFTLHPVVNISTLHVTGGVPGTQVTVDGKLVGTVGQDGSMPGVQVGAGSHAVHLSAEEHKPKSFQLSFVGGKDVTLTGADAALDATYGTLVLAVNPAGAQFVIQRSAADQPRPLNANPAHLAEGSYIVTASARGYITQSQNIDIATGSTKNLSFQLAAQQVVEKKQVTRLGMSAWQSLWTLDGDHFTRKGGDLVLYPAQGPGTYSFTASMAHGKVLRWVAHVIDERNYLEFEMDKENFSRSQIIDGKRHSTPKHKHNLDLQSVGGTIVVQISPSGITQSAQKGNGWVALDSWADPSFVKGRFGFYIHGSDQVNLAGFTFTGSE